MGKLNVLVIYIDFIKKQLWPCCIANPQMRVPSSMVCFTYGLVAIKWFSSYFCKYATQPVVPLIFFSGLFFWGTLLDSTDTKRGVIEYFNKVMASLFGDGGCFSRKGKGFSLKVIL